MKCRRSKRYRNVLINRLDTSDSSVTVNGIASERGKLIWDHATESRSIMRFGRHASCYSQYPIHHHLKGGKLQ